MFSNEIINKIAAHGSNPASVSAFLVRATVPSVSANVDDWGSAVRHEVAVAFDYYPESVFSAVSLAGARLRNLYGASVREFISNLGE